MDEHKEFDMIAIGDIVTDAFIRIKQASVYYDSTEHTEKICLINGGKIPYEFTKVIRGTGNSANADVAATRLGLHTALVTNLGDDDNGKEILKALDKDGINQKFIRVHPGKISNFNYVLWFKDERTILIRHEDYDYVLPDIGEPKWIYFSSVSENSMDYHRAIAEYLHQHPNVKLAFQPGTFQVKLGIEALKDIYTATEVFFCNKEEAQRLLKTEETNTAKLAKEMTTHGPKIAVITDGEHGAFMYDGENAWSLAPFPSTEAPYERTGAGDSFASTFTSALILGKSHEEALIWGAANSRNVIQYVGAQEGLLTRDELEKRIANKPADYGPQKVTL
jgi:ribokinase